MIRRPAAATAAVPHKATAKMAAVHRKLATATQIAAVLSGVAGLISVPLLAG
jgi:hypothetical protein